MPRFLIQLTHDSDHEVCIRALNAIQRYGGHLFMNADWGCKVGVHSGWVIADLDSRDEAMLMVPPEFRSEAQVIELNRFTKEEIAAWVAKLGIETD